jgi:hypothetical protein
MRKVLAGPGPDGRSTILADEPIAESAPGPSRAATEIWMPPTLSPELPYLRPKTIEAAELDVGIPPGAARTIYSVLAPGHEVPMHRTDTYDVAFVIRGSWGQGWRSVSVDLGLPGPFVLVSGRTELGDLGWGQGRRGIGAGGLCVQPVEEECEAAPPGVRCNSGGFPDHLRDGPGQADQVG